MGSGRGRHHQRAWMVPFIPSCPQELRPRGLDVKQEELGDLVDKEMAATAAAIETASARIEVRVTMSRGSPCWGPAQTTVEAREAHWAQHSLSPFNQEMLSKARAGDTGVKLEVNER